MLSSPNVAGHGFFENVVRQDRVGHEGVFVSLCVSFLQALDELFVFILELFRVRGFDPLRIIGQCQMLRHHVDSPELTLAL